MERGMRGNFWILIGFLAVLFLTLGLAQVAQADALPTDLAQEAIPYVQGGWKMIVKENVLDKEGKDEDEKIAAFLVIGGYQKDEKGGVVASVSVYADKKMSAQIGSGLVYPYPYSNYIYAWVDFDLGVTEFVSVSFSAFVTGKEINGRFFSQIWGPTGIWDPEGFEYWVPVEIDSGEVTLKRIF